MDRHSESDYEDISGTVTMLRVREAELVARVEELAVNLEGVELDNDALRETLRKVAEQVRELKDLLVLPE
jgi:hypothetical protein